jgi:small-conductance mechanosensitive channel
MHWVFDGMPWWVMRLVWTATTVAIAYLVGHGLRAFVLAKISHFAGWTSGAWDDILIQELRRRALFWSLLVGLWLSLGHWELRPDVRGLAIKILIAVAGASITFMAAAVANRLMVAYSARVMPGLPVSGLTQNVARIVVILVGALVILDGLGLNIAPMLTALGVGGLAVALALQDPLSNLFAGLAISLAGQIRIGDYVKLDTGQEGFVVDFDWRSTRIRMLANNLVVVPNAALSKAIVTNYSLPEADLAVIVQVSVDYGSDLGLVERVTIEVAREVMQQVPGGVPSFEPFIRFHTFADSGINFSVILRGQQFVDQYLVMHEFVKRLQARYQREGISIPFPIRAIAPREPIPVVVRSGGGS